MIRKVLTTPSAEQKKKRIPLQIILTEVDFVSYVVGIKCKACELMYHAKCMPLKSPLRRWPPVNKKTFAFCINSILASLLSYAGSSYFSAVHQIRCFSLPEEENTAGFQNVVVRWKLDDGRKVESHSSRECMADFCLSCRKGLRWADPLSRGPPKYIWSSINKPEKRKIWRIDLQRHTKITINICFVYLTTFVCICPWGHW